MNALLISALEESKQVFVQPAAGNAGTALGAVFYAWNNVFGQKKRASLNDLCLGPGYTAEQVKQVLENCKLRFHYLMTTEELLDRAVRDLNGEKIIAWMQGRMEFGPRALGNRSILASPLNPYSTENLNIYIKHRESFRKFAASVPEEMASEYFEAGPNARYLATVGRVRAPYRKIFDSRCAGRGRRARSPGSPRRTIRCFTNCFWLLEKRRAFRCSTTPASIFSATRWSVRRAMPCAASIPPAWTRCTSAISSSKNKPLVRGWLFHVINHHDIHQCFGRLELQPNCCWIAVNRSGGASGLSPMPGGTPPDSRTASHRASSSMRNCSVPPAASDPPPADPEPLSASRSRNPPWSHF